MNKVLKEYSKFQNEFGWGKLTKDYLFLIESKSNKFSIILDAGCGQGGTYAKSKINNVIKRKQLIGVDLGSEKNLYLDKKVVASLEKLPFDDESFNVICCEWVVEHLKNPHVVFKEFSRVLKKGGHIVILTPNILNPLVFFGGLVSSSVKDVLLRRLIKAEDKDLFPLELKCNSEKKITEVAKKFGLKKVFAKTYPNPAYFKHNKPILGFILLLEKLIQKAKIFDFIKMDILISFKKLKKVSD